MIASFCLSLSLPVIADSMKPGATQLTVMLRVAISWRQRLGEADHAGLRGDVVGLAGIAGDADHRGDVDDAAEAAAHHRMRELARQPEHGAEIDVDHRVEILVRHAHEQPVLGDAGIVDQDVDAFELGLGLLAERLDLAAVGQIRPERSWCGRRARRPAPRASRRGCRAGRRSRPAHAARARSPRRCRRKRR